MLIKNNFEVAQPVEKVWRFFDNIPQVAACLPGTELTDDLGDNKYLGKVAIGMGPVRLQFAGTAQIKERDDAAKRVEVALDLQLSGAAAQYGRGMISDVTAILMRDFASNMQNRMNAVDRGLSPDQAGTARAASGFGIALRAMRLALGRVLRRFFLPYQPSPS